MPKHQREFKGFDDKVLSAYAPGLATRRIRDRQKEIYAVEVRMPGEEGGSERPGGVKAGRNGGERPASLSRPDDAAGMEACSVAFPLGRYLRETAGRAVCVLKAGKPRMIRNRPGRPARRTGGRRPYSS